MFEVSYFIWEQEWIRHKLIVYWEKPLKTTYNHTKYILLRKMVHKRISVKYAFSHFNDVQIMISKSHSIPKNASITWLISLPISILSNYILYRVQLRSTMIGINHSLRSSYLPLLFSIHNVIRMNSVIIISMIWISWYLI